MRSYKPSQYWRKRRNI